MKRTRFLHATHILISTLFFACGGDPTGPDSDRPSRVISVVVTPSSETLVSQGETVDLTASARDANGRTISGKTFNWQSPDVSIATVNSSGLVTAVSSGSVTITATTDGVSGTASITVAIPSLEVSYDSLSAAVYWFSTEVTNWREGIQHSWALALCETVLNTCDIINNGGVITDRGARLGFPFTTFNNIFGLVVRCGIAQSQGGEVLLVLAAALPDEEAKQAVVALC